MTQQVAIFLVMMFKCFAAIFAFPCCTILLTNSAISLRILGTLNGVATSVSAIGRAVGPAIGGWSYTRGVDLGYVIIPWFTLSALSALGAIPVWWLIEMEGFGGADDSSSEDEEGNGTILNTDDEREPEGRSSATREVRNSGAGTNLLGAEEDDDFAIEDDPIESTKMLSRTTTHSSSLEPTSGGLPRRMTSPIGQRAAVGPGGSRKLSNGIGQTRSGFGAGATSYS